MSSDTGENLWHYMSLEKFLWLLHDKRLHFQRLNELRKSDRKEGMLPAWLEQQINYVLTQKLGEQPRDVRAKLEDEADRSFVFCWNKDESESALMWACYGDNGGGVCLQTTRSKFRLPLSWGPKRPMHVHYIDVDYIDHNDGSPSQELYDRLQLPPYSLAQFKSSEFKSENELRLVAVLAKENLLGDPVELGAGEYPRLVEVQEFSKEGNKFVWTSKLHETLEKIVAGPKMNSKTFDFLKGLIEREFPVRFEHSTIAESDTLQLQKLEVLQSLSSKFVK